MPVNKRPFLGAGLSFSHIPIIFEKKPKLDFLEVHAENCLGDIVLNNLKRLRETYELSIHGVGLSLGSASGLCNDHLSFLKRIINNLDPIFFSEHISWTQVNGFYTNNLLPIPYTKESLEVLNFNIQKAQEYLGRRILLENPSSYLGFSKSVYTETDFLSEICKKTGCALLLDINNVFVSSKNLDFDPYDYFSKFPFSYVEEIHLAGHRIKRIEGKDFYIDDHGDHVSPDVWELYRFVLRKTGKKPTLVEWDNNVPDLEILCQEIFKVGKIMDSLNSKKEENKYVS